MTIEPDGRAPLIIGQCPPNDGRTRGLALYPHPRNFAGYRLWRMCQEAMAPEPFGRAAYLRTFRRLNVLHYHVQTFKPAAVPDKVRDSILQRCRAADVYCVVLCGYAIAESLGMGRIPYCVASSHGTFGYSIIPHPSGLNRWYNVPANRALVVEHLGNLIEGYRRRPEDWDSDHRAVR